MLIKLIYHSLSSLSNFMCCLFEVLGVVLLGFQKRFTTIGILTVYVSVQRNTKPEVDDSADRACEVSTLTEGFVFTLFCLQNENILKFLSVMKGVLRKLDGAFIFHIVILI